MVSIQTRAKGGLFEIPSHNQNQITPLPLPCSALWPHNCIAPIHFFTAHISERLRTLGVYGYSTVNRDLISMLLLFFCFFFFYSLITFEGMNSSVTQSPPQQNILSTTLENSRTICGCIEEGEAPEVPPCCFNNQLVYIRLHFHVTCLIFYFFFAPI